MHKTVEKPLQTNDLSHQNALTDNKAYWSHSYEQRLQALFEAIIAEDIAHRPSPDDSNTAK